MKSRSLNRKIAVVLSILLLLSMVNVAVAYGGENVTESKGSYQKLMDSLGLDTDVIKPATASEENFAINFDNDVTSIVNKTVLENGDVKISISESDLTNEVLIKPDGTTYIDGSLVTVSEDNGDFFPLQLNYEYYASTVQPRLNDYNFTTTCPYGSASDYTDSRTYKDVVSLGTKVFSTVTQTAWISIITGLVGTLSAPASVAAGLFIAGALEYLKTKTPSSNASSIMTVKSFHKTKGYTVKNGMSVAKYDVTYYTNSDFTGVIKNSAGKSVFSGYDVFTW